MGHRSAARARAQTAALLLVVLCVASPAHGMDFLKSVWNALPALDYGDGYDFGDEFSDSDDDTSGDSPTSYYNDPLYDPEDNSVYYDAVSLSDAPDQKFGKCDVPPEEVGPAHPIYTEVSKKYPIVFDIGEYVVGLRTVTLSKASFSVLYEHTDGRFRTMFRNFDPKTEFEPAELTLIVKDIVLEKKDNRESWLTYKPTTVAFEGAVVTAKLMLDVNGRYDEVASRFQNVTVIDILDRDLNDPENGITVKLADCKWSLEGGNRVIRKAAEWADWYLGLVNTQVVNMIGNKAKCILRTQPANLSGVHLGAIENRASAKLLEECATSTDGKEPSTHTLNVCRTIIYKNSGDDVSEVKELQARSADMALELLGTLPIVKFVVSADGSGTYDTAKLRYHLSTTVDIPAQRVFNGVLIGTQAIFDNVNDETLAPTGSLEEESSEVIQPAALAQSDTMDPELEYMRKIFKEWLTVNMGEAAQVAAIIEYLKSASTDRKTELVLKAEEVSVNIKGEGSGKAPDMGWSAKTVETVLDNSDSTRDAYFPVDLYIESAITQRNRDHIQFLCEEEYKDAPEKWPQCVSEGEAMNAQRVKIPKSRLVNLLASERYTIAGLFGFNSADMHFRTVLGPENWKRYAQAYCDVDNTLCQDVYGLFGQYMVAHPTEFEIWTPDTRPKAGGRSWEGGRRRGLLISKKDFLVNLEIEFLGVINVGTLVAMVVNSHEYVKMAAQRHTPLAHLDIGRGVGNAIVGATDLRAHTPWRRDYDLGAFLGGLELVRGSSVLPPVMTRDDMPLAPVDLPGLL